MNPAIVILLTLYSASSYETGSLIRMILGKQEFTGFSPASALKMAEGILMGLQPDTPPPKNCIEALSSTVTLGQRTLTDIRTTALGDIPGPAFATDAQWLLSSLASFPAECVPQVLFSALESPDRILQNFFAHSESILGHCDELKSCRSEYRACGVALGSVVKLLLGESLGMSAALSGFLSGVHRGLENSLCAAGQELQLHECECSVPVLLDKLRTADGWTDSLRKYVNNEETVNRSLEGLSDCLSDLAECGVNIGIVLRLVVK